MKAVSIIEFPTADKITVTYVDGTVIVFTPEVAPVEIPKVKIPLNTPIELISE